MLLDGTIVNADVNASAAIAGTKIAPDFGSQTVQTTGVVSHALGTALAPTVTFTGDTNTGLYSPGADQVAISTNGTGRLFVDASGNVGVNQATPASVGAGFTSVDINGSNGAIVYLRQGGTPFGYFGGNGTEQYVWASSAIPLTFGTNNTERMRLDSSGRLGLGNSSPSNTLHVSGTGSTQAAFERTGSNGCFIGLKDGSGSLSYLGTTNGVFSIQTPGSGYSDKLVVTSAGNIGIGNTVPGNYSAVDANDLVVGTNSGNNGITIVGGSTGYSSLAFADSAGTGGNGDYPGLIQYGHAADSMNFFTGALERARIDSSGRLLVGTSTAYDASTTLQVKAYAASAGPLAGVLDLQANYSSTIGDQQIGWIRFLDANGAYRAQIACVADGTSSSSSDAPGRLVFSTTADGASSPTERMRIGSNGILGSFSAASTDAFIVSNGATAGTTVKFISGRYGALGMFDGTESFFVYTNGNVANTNNSYGAISDIKLKENIVDANSQWDDLKALQVRNYNFKEGQTHTQIGLVAQEAELVSPGLVSESPDRDEDGNDLGTVTKSVNYSVLYMKAVKALQEAMERIETLEAKVAALQGV
jgi:hypothetical protein